MTNSSAVAPQVSVVVPVRNEVGNLAALVDELEQALASRLPFEVIVIDDGSDDGSGQEVSRLAATRPWLRQFRHQTSCGKSSAIKTGVKGARAPVIVTLDGDGQNDPAFIPPMLSRLAEIGPSCGLVHGQRLGRKDTAFKRLQSRIANAVRGAILRDGTRDTGCGFTCFPRAVYLDLPFFDGLHRFMPALVRRDGYVIAYVEVVDRPRMSGVSKYGFFGRLGAGIVDLLGVGWLIARRKAIATAKEVGADDL